MAYVDQAFSITDDDLMMDDHSFSYTVTNRPPIKEIAFAVSLLVFGILVIVSGVFMSLYKVGGDHAHGVFFAILGSILFIPGCYYTWVAYSAYKGYKRFSFSENPPQQGLHNSRTVPCRTESEWSPNSQVPTAYMRERNLQSIALSRRTKYS